MSIKRSVGSSNAVQNLERLSFSPSNGFSFSANIEGPKESVRPFIYQLAQLGYSFEYVSDRHPFATISYSAAGDLGGLGGATPEQPALVWEFFSNRHEIDILEADISGSIQDQSNFNAAFTSTKNKRLLREAIANPDPDAPAPTFEGDNAADATVLYQLMLAGVRNFRVDVPTLRVSKLVSSTYAVQASQSNVRRIITTDTLVTQENVPTRLFTLPDEDSLKTGFVYGWYKSFPHIQVAAGSRTQVSQEWEYGLWPLAVYGRAL